ncbi:hypothetical protein C8Q79DRAFT_1012815 [Trametes meyenii]|nr:hypothetical protein C8Q79DRAFT_1012815 [Trametes meyenii]
MFAARHFVVLAVVGSALALSTRYPRDANGALVVRDSSPSDADLLSSCPGGPGSSDLKGADRCTLINIVNNPNARTFEVLGDPQLKHVPPCLQEFCGGATDPITVELGGSTEVSQTTSVNIDVGFEAEGLSIGGGASEEDSKSTTVSKTISYSIPPGRQAVYVAGTAQKSETGNVQVNYGSRQFGHFIWFTGATVTRLTPISSDVVFDVHESDCGTDPRNINQ